MVKFSVLAYFYVSYGHLFNPILASVLIHKMGGKAKEKDKKDRCLIFLTVVWLSLFVKNTTKRKRLQIHWFYWQLMLQGTSPYSPQKLLHEQDAPIFIAVSMVRIGSIL